MKRVLACLFLFMPAIAMADWKPIPDVQSKLLWQLVGQGDADVVSSVAFGDPAALHSKQTVFRLRNIPSADFPLAIAETAKGQYAPVLCTEVWNDRERYRGSSCSVLE
ncbi:MAG: hypothetical protein AAF699_01170 [Pseudomonadota bacterium]